MFLWRKGTLWSYQFPTWQPADTSLIKIFPIWFDYSVPKSNKIIIKLEKGDLPVYF